MRFRHPRSGSIHRKATHLGGRVACFAAALATLCGFPLSAAGRDRLSVYQEEAVQRSPELRVMFQQIRAQRARASSTGALPDPKLSVGWSNFPLKYPVSMFRAAMTGIEVGIEQRLPFPGKLGYAEEAEVHAATALAARLADARRRIRAAVAQVYYEIFFVDRALDLTRKTKKLLDGVTQHALSMLSTGRGLRQDVLRARAESAMLDERIFALEARRRSAEARFNFLLVRPPTRPVPAPPEPVAPPVVPVLSQLLERAERERPLLRAQAAEIRRAEASLLSARRAQYPDFFVAGAYRFRAGPPNDSVQGSDFYSIRFGLTIPIWHASKQAMKVRERQALLAARRANYDAERIRVLFQVRRLYEELVKERRTLPLYERLLRPLSLETLRASIPAYLTGKLEFHTVLRSWSQTYQTDVGWLRALANFHIKAAALEAAVGAPFGGR